MNVIINTVLTSIVTFLLGMLVTQVKHYRIIKLALLDMIRSNLTNQYYAYKGIGKVPRYIKESWYKMFERYVSMGGNSFIVHEIEPKWNELDIED